MRCSKMVKERFRSQQSMIFFLTISSSYEKHKHCETAMLKVSRSPTNALRPRPSARRAQSSGQFPADNYLNYHPWRFPSSIWCDKLLVVKQSRTSDVTVEWRGLCALPNVVYITSDRRYPKLMSLEMQKHRFVRLRSSSLMHSCLGFWTDAFRRVLEQKP
jgi:hypothetical protein